MTPETVVIVEEPPDLASVTVLPATGFDCASRSVTVIVELVEPSAVTDAGAAATDDCAAVTAPATKLTDAVCATVTESVVSCAVKTVVSATVSLTVNVATPEPFVTPETVVIVEEPPPFASVTVFPGTGLPFESRSVAVSVEAELPSAVTDAGAAVSVDWPPLTEPAEKVTDAVCVTATASVVSVAVYETVSAVVSETAKVASPAASVVAESGVDDRRAAAGRERHCLAGDRIAVHVAQRHGDRREARAVGRDRRRRGGDRGLGCRDGAGENVTVAVWVTVTESVVSVAV